VKIDEAKQAALEVLLHNVNGPYHQLPRTAGWGYPEPYTRDLLISSLGILVSGNRTLIDSLRRVLKTLGENQSPLGHISSLVHSKKERGASDTTPLFLLALAIFRRFSGEKDFLLEAGRKALDWMDYQSPADRVMVAQQPTSDWRDEQWVMGFGLFVNTIVYSYLKAFGLYEKAQKLQTLMGRFTITAGAQNHHVHEGLVLRHKPYYALWTYKVYSSERFDLLGNSLAVLSGLASPSRANHIISWIEAESAQMRSSGELALELPPNFFPYIKPTDPDWMPRYETYNRPGEYHNGGIWPFICGFYIAACVAAGRIKLAENKLAALTDAITKSRRPDISFGFNEWIKAQDGIPRGEDWQSWSAAMYLYAAECVDRKKTPFFDKIRGQ
jgi:hypothetical protein